MGDMLIDTNIVPDPNALAAGDVFSAFANGHYDTVVIVEIRRDTNDGPVYAFRNGHCLTLSRREFIAMMASCGMKPHGRVPTLVERDPSQDA